MSRQFVVITPGSDDIRPPNTSAAAVADDKPPADDAGKVLD